MVCFEGGGAGGVVDLFVKYAVSRIKSGATTRGYKIGIVCVFIDRICGRSSMELCAAVMVQSIRPLVR